ncbi:OmpA family protein [Motilimonas pumila]|nr:OmpA family protein [Motilimonas pumila]
MDKLSKVFATLSFSLLAACSHKAPPSQGGFAEHDLTYTEDVAHRSNHPVGMENALYFEQQMSMRHLQDLIQAGANICFPASVKEAQIRQNRIARELQGGLEADAANDLIIQRDKLARLERRLNYVQLQDTCVYDSPQQVAPITASHAMRLSDADLQRLTRQLNNNNQFVTDSSELNPRYIGQLAQVCAELKDHRNITIVITGHTDAKGQSAANLTLSLERAKQVERYLQIFGINPSLIQVKGNGEHQPLYQGDAPQIDLINRRVTIELLAQASPLGGNTL